MRLNHGISQMLSTILAQAENRECTRLNGLLDESDIVDTIQIAIASLEAEQLATDVREYVGLLNGPVNGIGAHVHPFYGVSHRMLNTMNERHGKAKFTVQVDELFKVKRESA